MNALSTSRPMQVVDAHNTDSRPMQANESLGRLGFWSAVLTALFSITFSVSGLLGLFHVTSFPWDPVIPEGAVARTKEVPK
jgi:hypothetical protein